MLMGISVDTREAERAMRELFRESERELPVILKFNAIDLTKSLVFNTTKKSGNLRAGWWPGYRALNIPGSPRTRRQLGENLVGKGKKKRRYIAAGHVIDRRTDMQDPSIEIVNTSHMFLANGKRVDYPWVRRRGSSPAERTLAAANREVTFKWHNRLEKAMKKRSAR